jgi:hypothetical protein
MPGPARESCRRARPGACGNDRVLRAGRDRIHPHRLRRERDAFELPQEWNRYAYAANNPLRFTDYLGLQVVPCPTKENPDRLCWPDPPVVVVTPPMSGGGGGGTGTRGQDRPGNGAGNNGDPRSPTPPTPKPPDPRPPPPPPPPPPAQPPQPPNPVPPPRSVQWFSCFGIGVVLLRAPVEAAAAFSCAITGPGWGACMLVEHEAAFPALEGPAP